MKYFIGADIEAPHLSFYAELDDPHFAGRWSWADKNGLPEKGINVLFFDNIEDAQNALNILKESGAGIDQHIDTIQIVPLDV